MAEIESTTRKMGGSIGIILPNEFVRKEGIRQNQKIRLEIRKVVRARDVFGMFSGWKTPAQKLKDEAREGW